MKDIVIYHTLCGKFDDFRQPLQYHDEYDYVLFTDQSLLIDKYVLREFDQVFEEPTRTAKKPKILPHRYFPNYKISIYLDANFHITGNIKQLIDKYKDNPFTVFYHTHPTQGKKRTIHQELKECIEAKLDDRSLMEAQVEYYIKNGYKKEFPHNVCGFMIRHHHNPAIIAFMEEWWSEICKWSKRDQLSFPFVQWKHRLDLSYIDFHMYKSPYWKKFDHNWKKRKK